MDDQVSRNVQSEHFENANGDMEESVENIDGERPKGVQQDASGEKEEVVQQNVGGEKEKKLFNKMLVVLMLKVGML